MPTTTKEEQGKTTEAPAAEAEQQAEKPKGEIVLMHVDDRPKDEVLLTWRDEGDGDWYRVKRMSGALYLETVAKARAKRAHPAEGQWGVVSEIRKADFDKLVKQHGTPADAKPKGRGRGKAAAAAKPTEEKPKARGRGRGSSTTAKPEAKASPTSSARPYQPQADKANAELWAGGNPPAQNVSANEVGYVAKVTGKASKDDVLKMLGFKTEKALREYVQGKVDRPDNVQQIRDFTAKVKQAHPSPRIRPRKVVAAAWALLFGEVK